MSQSCRSIRIKADVWRGLHRVKAKEGKSISKIVEELYNLQYGDYIDFTCRQTFINPVSPLELEKLNVGKNRQRRRR